VKKKLLFLSMAVCLFADPKVVKEDSVLQNQFDAKMKAQNKTIVKMSAEETKKHLPQKVDKYTTMTGVDYKGTNLIYIYEINVPPKSDKELIKEAQKKMMPLRIKRNSCLSAKRFLKSDITLTYVYKSAKTKNTLFKVDVNKNDCRRIW